MCEETPSLDRADQDRLLAWARRVAQAYLEGNALPARALFSLEGVFGGAFVTFWLDKTLRGCVGRFARITDVVEAVGQITVASLQDPRFADRPITSAELDTLSIEISLLSAPVIARNPRQLKIGTHGIIVRSGQRSGCFLPKVAVERGWSPEEFLANCCTMKAGLPADAWQRDTATVYMFTASAFADEVDPQERGCS
ncbi:MAG: AmmeMemoRadiSam system protein A [Phycisphaerae bacterium]